MNRRNILKLGLGLGLAPPAMAADMSIPSMDDTTYKRISTRRQAYPPEFYILGNDKGKSLGVHRIKIDNRTLEIILPNNPPPDDFSMPQALHTTGATIESMLIYLANRSGGVSHELICFKGYWSHQGFFSGSVIGGVGASVVFEPNPYGFVRDETRDIPKSLIPGSRLVKTDYFKLDDFILSLQSWPPTGSFLSVIINGRRWVQTGYYWGRDKEKYKTNFYTPIDRHRKLNVLAYLDCDYKIPDEMPDWMRKMSDNITSVLRSIKLSRPDDGSEDPVLLDPEQKPSLPLIEFPASPASG
jgi:hypothetical protein